MQFAVVSASRSSSLIACILVACECDFSEGGVGPNVGAAAAGARRRRRAEVGATAFAPNHIEKTQTMASKAERIKCDEECGRPATVSCAACSGMNFCDECDATAHKSAKKQDHERPRLPQYGSADRYAVGFLRVAWECVAHGCRC